METYGYASHDSKVDDYKQYKKKRFQKRKDELNGILVNIRLCSLLPEDKITLYKELADIINKRINKLK